MTGKTDHYYFGQGLRENLSFALNAGESMTLHFKDDGTDTTTDVYFNIGHFAKKVSIRNSQIATITHINGVELKSPITLGTAAPNIWSVGFEWNTITIRADVNSTSFEVYGA